MLRTSFPRLCIAATCFGIAGCATLPSDNRARIVEMPMASIHADIAFTMVTGFRQDAGCEDPLACPAVSDGDAAPRFASQVRRMAAALQNGARRLYPDLEQRVPGLIDHRFDVYVVGGDEPGSASSSNGRIALNAALGDRQPYDDWMAFVIAREMGHIIARHHEENSSAGIVTSVIMNILIPGSSLLKSLMSAGASGIAAKSQREVQAQEADVIALNLLRAAGFRLRDISLTLRIGSMTLDDGAWSKRFKTSADYLIAEVRRSEFAVATAR